MGCLCDGEIVHKSSYGWLSDSCVHHWTSVSFPAAVMMRFMPMLNRMGETAHPATIPFSRCCHCMVSSLGLKLHPSKAAGNHSLDVLCDMVVLQRCFDELMGNRSLSVGQIQTDRHRQLSIHLSLTWPCRSSDWEWMCELRSTEKTLHSTMSREMVLNWLMFVLMSLLLLPFFILPLGSGAGADLVLFTTCWTSSSVWSKMVGILPWPFMGWHKGVGCVSLRNASTSS